MTPLISQGRFPRLPLLFAALLALAACSPTVPPSPDEGSPDDVVDGGPGSDPDLEEEDEDLDGLVWAPSFEPDYNTLVPQPWVEVVTTRQAETVVVGPQSLSFPADGHPEVLLWEAGRIVVSAPSDGPGANPLGFARRVRSVQQVGELIVVLTETVALQDIVTGDLQQTIDFSQVRDVDLSKLDLEWAAENLYVDAEVFSPDLELSADDEPLPELDDDGNPIPGDPFLGKAFKAVKKGVSAVGNALGGAAKAVASGAQAAWQAVTPASFGGSVSMNPEMKARHQSQMFSVDYKKSFNDSGRAPVELQIKGSGSVDADVLFRPGVQVGMRIPNIGHNATFATWMNVDSQFRSIIELDVELAAEIASSGGLTTDALQKRIEDDAAFAADVLSQARQRFTGHPDMRPAGGWKRTIMISKPATKVVMAGPVPVVFTQTFQVDMECGFGAKAALKANMRFERNSNLKFSTRYESGRVTSTKPVFENRKVTRVNVTGGGEVAVSCGLIPRVNVFVYDSAGLNAGVRGSLVAQAAYESKCVADALVSRPRADVSVGLYGNVGVQVGGRVQAPGSSFAGKAGQSAGFDIGPFEPWNTQFPIYERTWDIAGGLGYCTPTCRNGARDAKETDADCGGGSCNACDTGKRCAKNTDCAKGYCSGGFCSDTDHCGDGVQSGDETGIDCGGSKCRACRVGIACYQGRDCLSGFCAVEPGSGSQLGVCVQNHCADFQVSGDETGIDCGGATCPKCPVGARSSVEADCASGVSDGTFCVPGTCKDRVLTPGESDVDCGGSSLCGRCGPGKGCSVNGDCSSSAPVCDRVTSTCTQPRCADGVQNGDETGVDCGGSCGTKCGAGEGCAQHSDCGAGLECDPLQHTCVAPSCNDGRRNGSETDVDCGGACPAGCGDGQSCQTDADCAAGVPICDPSLRTCGEFLRCGPGQYRTGADCVNAGVGFWSAAGDDARATCTNAPANAEYTSQTASSAQCPWTCSAGHLLDSTTGTCRPNATVRYLRCEPHEVAVGVHGRAGGWLDALGVLCAPFDGTRLTGPARSAPSIGGSGGGAFTLSCAAGEVLHRVHGFNGWSTSAPNASWCSQVNLSTVNISCVDLSTGAVTQRGVAGGSNSQCTAPLNPPYSQTCPAGSFLQGVAVDSENTTGYVGYMLGAVCR